MAVINDTFRQYRTDLSQWAVVRLNTDGTWERINPLADIDEELLHGGHYDAEFRDKVGGYIDGGDEIGSVLAVGVWRRLETTDTPTLAAVYSEGTLVHDKDALAERETIRYSEYLASGAATPEEIAAAQHTEQAVDPDSPGTVPGVGDPNEPVDDDDEKGGSPFGDPVEIGVTLRSSGGSVWWESKPDNQDAVLPASWFGTTGPRRFARLRYRADGQFRLYFRPDNDTTDPNGSQGQEPLVDAFSGTLGIRAALPDGSSYETTLPASATKTTFYSWDEPVTAALIAVSAAFLEAGTDRAEGTVTLTPPTEA